MGPKGHFDDHDPYPEVRFPGMGAITWPNTEATFEAEKTPCGTLRYHVVCPTHPEHYHRPIPHSCKRQTCPECWWAWASRAAERIAEQIGGYRKTHTIHYAGLTFGRKDRAPRHVILSPAPEQISKWMQAAKGDYEVFKRRFMNWGRKQFGILGFRAAAVVPHYYRLRDEKQAEASELAETPEIQKLYGYMAWASDDPPISAEIEHKTNRYRAPLRDIRAGNSVWTDWFEFSPHLHLIAFGFARVKSAAYHRVTGSVYRVIRSVNNVAGLAWYLLSHCGVSGRGQRGYTYWGGMSPKYLKKVDRWVEEEAKCPVCGETLYDASELRDGSYMPEKPHMRRVHTPWFERRGTYRAPKISERMSGRFRAAMADDVAKLVEAFR